MCSQILSTAESCRRRRPREVSQFASRDSLLVGRNFPVPEFREIRRVGPRGGVGRENLAHPEAGFGGVPCIFPADQGFRQKRRVRDRLHAPPLSLLLQRLPARTRAQPEKSPRFRGSWPSSPRVSEPESASSGPESAAARICLCCQVGRFGFALDSPRQVVRAATRLSGNREAAG